MWAKWGMVKGGTPFCLPSMHLFQKIGLFFFQMVYKYKRKTDRQSWSIEKMQRAVEAVVSGKMGYHRASISFAVPQTTLERHVKRQRDNAGYSISKVLGSKRPVFTPQQEEELVGYLKEMEARLFGLTITECRKLAFQLAEQNGIQHPFNKNDKMAGKGWMMGFFNRHKDLSIRKPEATSGARAMGFNKVAVEQFFKLLQETVEKYQLTADKIYNVDETGVTVNPKGNSKVIASKGKRQVGALTSAERGETITSEICFSASGAYMPPMLIFPRKRMQQSFLDGLVPGGWVELNEKGWIDKTLFFTWFKKFVEFSRASKESPVLLLLDGHSSHTKNLDVIRYGRENGVVMLCFPPHCTHRLQPLDVAFMKPLSAYYDDEVRKWLRTNPGRVVTLHQISSLFSAAYLRAATMFTAINGFKATGAWPVNMAVFSEAGFLPSATTDLEVDPSALKSQLEPIGQHRNTHVVQSIRETTPEPQPGTSKESDSSFQFVSPTAITAVPKVNQSKKRVSRKRGKTVILTSSPYKTELEVAQEKCKSTNTKSGKRKIMDGQIDSHKIKKSKVKKTKKAESDSEDENSDAECLYCGDFYSSSTEGWINCSGCHKWAHNSCAGIEEEDDEAILICEHCQ